MKQSTWRYTGKSEPPRIQALVRPRPWAELPEALREGLKLKCFHREARQNDHAYRRAVFCGSVNPSLFDQFFNASTGYRGSFFKSPEAGLRANRALLDQLADFLAGWAVLTKHEADPSWVLASLAQTSAKAWLAEYPGLCAHCEGEWSPSYVSDLQIENSRWECSSHVHSVWGRQAPSLSKIRIFGGFIDDQRNEWLAPHKAERATHIWEHGWS